MWLQHILTEHHINQDYMEKWNLHMNNSSLEGFPTIDQSLLENLSINKETQVRIKNQYPLTQVRIIARKINNSKSSGRNTVSFVFLKNVVEVEGCVEMQ